MHDNVKDYEQFLFFFYVPYDPKCIRKLYCNETSSIVFCCCMEPSNCDNILLVLGLEALIPFLQHFEIQLLEISVDFHSDLQSSSAREESRLK